jgi:hypothetical protein
MPEFTIAIEDLSENWHKPVHPHYAFFATDLDKSNIIRNRFVRQLSNALLAFHVLWVRTLGEIIAKTNTRQNQRCFYHDSRHY